LRPDHSPKVNVNGIEELGTDKGHHSGRVIKQVKSYEVRSCIPEKQQTGRRNWQGKPPGQQLAHILQYLAEIPRDRLGFETAGHHLPSRISDPFPVN